VVGVTDVAAYLRSGARSFAPLGRPAVVNGGPGVVVARNGAVVAVVGFTIRSGLITEIDIVGDLAKLTRVELP
jgi:RNA polymerase sigma-70 factor (ECF subfamily)